MNLQDYLQTAILAAQEASKVILDVYHSGDFNPELKGDNSPLTIADKRAHAVIEVILEATHLPLLSEEGRSTDYQSRKDWAYFWMVDPLDGTKEFIKQNGEFTVNIALIRNTVPVLGVVAVPVTGDVFFAAQGAGAFVIRKGETTKLPVRQKWDMDQKGLRVVASRSHMDETTRDFVSKLNEPTLISKGSSLKFMLLAEGLADIYPRFAPTMEWDTAAADAIVREAGLTVYQADSNLPLSYNKENLLNPYFIVK